MTGVSSPSTWSADEAFAHVGAQGRKHFDPRLVEAFLGAKREILQVQNEWRDPAQSR